MVFIAYQDCSRELGAGIYLIGLSLSLVYLLTLWLNYSVLVPNLLLKKSYIAYFLILPAVVFVLPLLAILQEYLVRNAYGLPHRISSYTNPLILIDSLSSFVLVFICISGIPVFVLLRRWLQKKEEVSRKEYEHIRSEINKLKGQIAPDFLSRALLNAESSIKSDPGKTSAILMKLGHLLRYQLYDCSREKVLLSSEINFITGYLELEQLNRDGFEYSLQTKVSPYGIFVSPMLFITLIQALPSDSDWLDISFHIENENIYFQCKSGTQANLKKSNFSSVEKSLDLQYPDKYKLLLKTKSVELILNIAG